MSTYPAGITDNSVEFFYTPEQGLKAFYAGRIWGWKSLPDQVKALVRRNLERHPKAVEALKMVGLSEDDRLRIFAKCYHGGFNNTPDICENGHAEAEHWDCQCTDCPLRGVLRHSLDVANGSLTLREIEVARLIARGLFGKEICAQLSISESTLNNHKRSIFRKTGVASNVELAKWALTINLI